jgi:hypothetical protein
MATSLAADLDENRPKLGKFASDRGLEGTVILSFGQAGERSVSLMSLKENAKAGMNDKANENAKALEFRRFLRPLWRSRWSSSPRFHCTSDDFREKDFSGGRQSGRQHHCERQSGRENRLKCKKTAAMDDRADAKVV